MDRGKERVAQRDHQVLREHPGLAALGNGVGHRGDRGPDVVVPHRSEDALDRFGTIRDAARSDDHVERRERVAGRASTLPDHVGHRRLVDVEPGVVHDPVDVGREFRRREQRELEVLRPASDGGQHLLRIRRRQHEGDVIGRLLQRLEQGVRGRRREHVHLVEDVHLGSAGRPDDGAADQVAHRVDTVVRCGVQLEQVVAVAVLDGEAALARAARFAGGEIGTVQRLREDARRRRLAGAAGAAEQVGVPFGAVGDRVAQRTHDRFLPADLGEAARAIAAIERLVRH